MVVGRDSMAETAWPGYDGIVSTVARRGTGISQHSTHPGRIKGDSREDTGTPRGGRTERAV